MFYRITGTEFHFFIEKKLTNIGVHRGIIKMCWLIALIKRPWSCSDVVFAMIAFLQLSIFVVARSKSVSRLYCLWPKDWKTTLEDHSMSITAVGCRNLYSWSRLWIQETYPFNTRYMGCFRDHSKKMLNSTKSNDWLIKISQFIVELFINRYFAYWPFQHSLSEVGTVSN